MNRNEMIAALSTLSRPALETLYDLLTTADTIPTIAAERGTSRSAIKGRINRIYTVLDVQSRTHLIQMWHVNEMDYHDIPGVREGNITPLPNGLRVRYEDVVQ